MVKLKSDKTSTPHSTHLSVSPLSNTPMALKILKKALVIRLKQIEHVKNEKEILQRLNHPFIVNLWSTFQDERCLYMVMEYVNGGELFSLLKEHRGIPVDHSRFYSSEIVVALEYIHNLDIVYRDLKPENLLLDSRGHLKITDFGFSKVVPQSGKTWTLCGTPEYLAPEVIQSKGHGKAVDWWALGVLIFEMISGWAPFEDKTPFGIYQKVLQGKIEFASCFDPSSKDLIRKLLVGDPSNRFGCLNDGVSDIKNHVFFAPVDWLNCSRGLLKPPVVPLTHSLDDTSMYDRYPESVDGAKEEAIPRLTMSGVPTKDLFIDF
eukprot:GHVN01010421.1.p1 GENE.GHVN01010421.1~~GHVN01010421.1.p1  ORF type:complete len:320 (+),score=47.77 GHVN01010421.1:212-1171(+)